MGATFGLVRTYNVQELEKEDFKKNSIEKKGQNEFFSSYHSFVFAIYIFISPNLQIILNKSLYTWVDLKE